MEEEIWSRNKRIDKVNEDLEGYHTHVDAIMLRQVEELGFHQCQDGSLEQNLETHVTEQ